MTSLIDVATVAPRPITTTPGGRPTAVRFAAVGQMFGGIQALDDVSFEIATGETVALLGPNGAGKTTAISLMLGLLDPSTGTVETLAMEPREAVATGRVGAMLQTVGLPSLVRVGELVEFARRLYPAPLAAADVIERAGLGALENRRVEGLSGGETQRLRFALAIAGDPDLVFLDEPTVAMDVETRRSFWSDMRRSAAEGRTILFATHYLEEADQVADRIIVLDHGRVVADGTGQSIKAAASARTVRFSLDTADRAVLLALPGVTSAEIRGSTTTLTSVDADATVRALYASGTPIRDLEVLGAGLEDAFVALTGDHPR
jgi:ABC-2 type transport system ATP-binding protein